MPDPKETLDISILLHSPEGCDQELAGRVEAVVREVHRTADSREAMFVFARNQPDMVLVDSPEGLGGHLEIVHALRRINPSLVSVVACMEGEPLRRAVAFGAEGYLIHPMASGDVARVLGDCACKVQSMRTAREQQRLADELLNSLPHPALLIERGSCRVVLANERARHLGFRVGEPCTGLFFPNDTVPSLAIESLYYRPAQLGMVKAAGREWDVTLAPATVNTVLLYAVDITERGRLERLRQDVERMVRHDLKTPLSGIIGMAQVLVEEGGLGGENLRCAELICMNAERMLRMIEESFSLIRMEEGVYVPRPEPFDFLAMLSGVAEDLSRQARTKDLRMRITVNGGEPDPSRDMIYFGEPLHLATCFSNLVKNALEASPTGAEVLVDVREKGELEVEIHNQGTVPKDVRRVFFERYASSGKAGGTGLGTYSARLIARSHGGDVTFTTSDSDGTRVLVLLPRMA